MTSGRQRSGPSSARRPRGPEDQAGNTFKYLYWRLSEKQFQQLCGTLLRAKFDPVQCFPVGMADEGIDAISHGSIVYQVKWTSKHQQNPATWLEAALEAEFDKIRKLVNEGRATRYILMTSVAATTTATGTGSLQKLQKTLDDYSAKLGIEVECWWQADIDAEVNLAGDGVKWSFQEMLAGSDAIRYLIFGTQLEASSARMRETMTKVLADQWRSDAQVRFSQVEMDRVSLAELFVDVRASLVAAPRNAVREFQRNPILASTRPRGAVDSLLDAHVPLTFLMGVPGQGKSTLTQFLCQVHRAVLLAQETSGFVPPSVPIREPKLPLRVELKDYAAWVDGFDTFDDERPRISKRRSRATRSAERYIAALCMAASGGRDVTVEDVHSLLERYPCLIVFDGLDEVADPDLRRIVVDEIEALAARMALPKPQLRSFQIVVTARPNATGLAEPSADQFQRIRLDPMDDALQNEFVIKWCDARGIDGAPRTELRRIFRDRTSLDHVSKLADNPMQLAILLYLISKKGDSVPVARTPLYADYMSTLMDREVARGQIGRNAVAQVQEVTAFLGWHMQAGVETNPTAGAMTRKDIETTLMLYLREVGADSSDAATLFRAASDRFWALTSETDELFKFAVQPVREYFAARFLAEWAGREQREPLSKQSVLRELLGRPYWLNTARFYAGFASPNELAALRYGVEDVLGSEDTAIEYRVASWALLSDAVFVGNTRVQRDVVGMLTDDLTVMLAREPQYSSDFPALALDSGGAQLATSLQAALERDPTHHLAAARVELLRNQSSLPRADFELWWREKLRLAAGTEGEARWLNFGCAYGIRKLDADASDKLTGSSATVAEAALGVGAVAPSGSPLSQGMLSAVLEGRVSDSKSRGVGEAGALLLAMRPQWFHRGVPGKQSPALVANGHLNVDRVDEGARNAAWKRLLNINPAYAALRSAARRGRSQSGTTEPWQAPARELTRIHGPSWLAAEIAVTGAAAVDLVASGSKDRDGVPFGPDVDYGTFVIEVHKRPDAKWWAEQHDAHPDRLSRRTWLLALIAAGSVEALTGNLPRIDAALASLTPEEFSATAASSSRISQNGSARMVPVSISLPGVNSRTLLMLAHFQNPRLSMTDIPELTDDQLRDLACPDASHWPIAEALAARIKTSPSLTLLEGVAALDLDSLSGIGGASTALERDLATVILRDPGRYPMEWVLHAEESTRPPGKGVLERVALENNWVPRVPRF